MANRRQAIERTNVDLVYRRFIFFTKWWRHQMETFSALLAICVGNSPVTGKFPSQRPVTQSFDVFFDLHLNKWLCKPSRRRLFETPSRSLWHHCNECSQSIPDSQPKKSKIWGISSQIAKTIRSISIWHFRVGSISNRCRSEGLCHRICEFKFWLMFYLGSCHSVWWLSAILQYLHC